MAQQDSVLTKQIAAAKEEFVRARSTSFDSHMKKFTVLNGQRRLVEEELLQQGVLLANELDEPIETTLMVVTQQNSATNAAPETPPSSFSWFTTLFGSK